MYHEKQYTLETPEPSCIALVRYRTEHLRLKNGESTKSTLLRNPSLERDELLAQDGPGLVLKLRKAMAISLNDGNVSCKIDNLSILRYF